MSNEELVLLIQEGVNVQENMGILYKQNQGFIRNTCFPFSEKADLDDLMQEAYFGLTDAVRDFDSTLGFTFLSYAKWKIRRCCLKYIKTYGNLKRIPEYMQNRISKYKKLIQEQGCVPDKETTMKRLNLTEEQFEMMLITMCQKEVVCIDEPLSSDGLSYADIVADGSDIEGDYIMKDTCDHLWKVLGSVLDTRKNSILIKHYKDDRSMKDIAEEEGVSVQRIHRIEKIALAELKKIDEVIQLAEQFGYDSEIAYSGKHSSTEFLAIKHIELEKKYQKLKKKFNLALSDLV